MSTKKNILYNSLYQILLIICPLITGPYLARVVGAEGIGIFSYTHSLMYYFALFGMLGTHNYGNRSIAKVRDDYQELNRTFWSIYFGQLMTSVFVIILYIIYLILFSEENKIYGLLWVFYMLANCFNITWLFFGLEKFKITVFRSSMIKILTVISILIFVNDKNDVGIYIFIISFGELVNQILLWTYLKKFVSFTKVSIKNIIYHIKPNFVLFIPVISVSIYKMMDKIMLGNMSSMIELGFYENTEKIINLPSGLITAVGIVMLPKMTNILAKGDDEEGKEYINKSMKFSMFMASAICFGISSIAPEFSVIFWGKEFVSCGMLIVCISPIVLFTAWANVIRTHYLIPKSKDKIYIFSVILGAIVNLVVNLLMIPKFEALGAVIGTVCAEFTVMFYQTWKIRHELDIIYYIKDAIICSIIGLIMFIGVRLIENINDLTIITLIYKIIIGAIIYLSLSSVYMLKNKKYLIERAYDKLKKGAV